MVWYGMVWYGMVWCGGAILLPWNFLYKSKGNRFYYTEKVNKEKEKKDVTNGKSF